jgi:hypothetical protein
MAAPQLAAVADALQGGQPQLIDGPESYVFGHLRRQDIRTALQALATAMDIVDGVRPRFPLIGRGG